MKACIFNQKHFGFIANIFGARDYPLSILILMLVTLLPSEEARKQIVLIVDGQANGRAKAFPQPKHRVLMPHNATIRGKPRVRTHHVECLSTPLGHRCGQKDPLIQDDEMGREVAVVL